LPAKSLRRHRPRGDSRPRLSSAPKRGGASAITVAFDGGRKGFPTFFEAPGKTIIQLSMSTFVSSGKVFVLGAGASAFAGYPLATGLLSFIRNFNSFEVKTKEKASRVIGKLNDAEFFFSRSVVRDPNGVANLEELLTYLELYTLVPWYIVRAKPVGFLRQRRHPSRDYLQVS